MKLWLRKYKHLNQSQSAEQLEFKLRPLVLLPLQFLAPAYVHDSEEKPSWLEQNPTSQDGGSYGAEGKTWTWRHQDQKVISAVFVCLSVCLSIYLPTYLLPIIFVAGDWTQGLSYLAMPLAPLSPFLTQELHPRHTWYSIWNL
jgi:hypothetical protein